MRLQSARILIIDDHPDLVENLQEILEAEGATIETAASAHAGLAKAQQPFDVALVDVRLPDAKGQTLVPQLKGDGTCHVLLVTGHASIQDAIEAVKAGAYAYVLKPFDPDEFVTTVQHAFEDVRLRGHAAELQHALEDREQALRTMVETVQALLLVLDAEHRVVQANPAVAAATGRPVAQIVGQRWVDSCVPPRARADMQQALEEVRTRTAVTTESLVIRTRKDGGIEERTITWSLAGAGSGDAFRIYASGMDLTDIRELERRTRLAEKLAAVGTVSAGLAHEIRNPLNAATLQLQLLERRVKRVSEDARVLEPLETVREEIARLGHLVTDFLTFARPTALDAVHTDLADLARGVLGLLEPVAAERKVALTLHTDGQCRGRRAADEAGPAEPRPQRPRRRRRRGRQGRRTRRARRCGRSDHRARQRSGRGRVAGTPRLRAVLHHEGGGHWPRHGDHAQGGGSARRRDRPAQRRGCRLHDHAPAEAADPVLSVTRPPSAWGAPPAHAPPSAPSSARPCRRRSPARGP
jgi:PAS domain S-box-containing protein